MKKVTKLINKQNTPILVTEEDFENGNFFGKGNQP